MRASCMCVCVREDLALLLCRGELLIPFCFGETLSLSLSLVLSLLLLLSLLSLSLSLSLLAAVRVSAASPARLGCVCAL